MEGITLQELHDSLLGGNLPEAELEKAREGQKLDYPEGIPECGADALRFGLLAYTQQGRDVNLDINRVAAYRRFCNKLWQVTNFMMLNMGDDFIPDADFLSRSAASHQGLEMRDRWLLGRLSQCAADCNRAMESYEFAGVTGALTRFILDELCDVYVEASKPVMYRGSEQQKRAALNTLWAALDVALRLMHPVMPFVTEELWQRLPGREQVCARYESIMIAPYPGATPVARLAGDDKAVRDAKALNGLVDPEADEYFGLANKVAAGMRSLVASFNIQSGRNIDFFIKVSGDDTKQRLLDLASSDLSVLARVKEVTVLGSAASAPEGCAAGLPDPNVQIYLQLQGLLNPADELLKVQAELLKSQANLDQLVEKTTSNFYARMAESAKEKLDSDIATSKAKIATLLEQQALFAKYV
jgi:valyl-tRNA synthetase